MCRYLCRPDAITFMAQETEENVCYSFTRGETALELGSLHSLHVMRKADMAELDVSHEVKKIWEDTQLCQLLYEVLCPDMELYR